MLSTGSRRRQQAQIGLVPVYRAGRREGALSSGIQLGDLVGSRDPKGLGAPSVWKPHVITSRVAGVVLENED